MIEERQCTANHRHEEHNWYQQTDAGLEAYYCPGK